MNQRAQILIHALQLQPHPEGGYYREVFQSPRTVQPADARPARKALTAIYFLLVAGQSSRWHCVQSDEVWSHLEGAPLALSCFEAERDQMTIVKLGPYSPETEPLRVVPAGVWQAAELLGEYALVGCYVGPGFDFSDFSLAAEHPAVAAAIRAHGAAPGKFL